MTTQIAEWPQELDDLVESLTYRPGWTVTLHADLDRGQGSSGTTLDVVTLGYNSRHPEEGRTYRVSHLFIVPAAAYDRRSWRRWLLERLLDVERHEACEFFQVAHDFPYAPSHGPGNDPYLVRELGTDVDQRTRFTGEAIPVDEVKGTR